jgi:hypothetical protein
MAQLQIQPRERIWKIIWKMNIRTKVNTFLCLLIHDRILTWDNLHKGGFIGPSTFPLCSQSEESTNHLLNLCTYNSNIWDEAAQIMRKVDRNRNNISLIIKIWQPVVFKNSILNRVWNLLLGFMIW